jgi:programmed cell death protein 4
MSGKKVGKEERLDRHSGSGLRGDPKKGGAGGKGVWGDIMIQDGPAALDKKDPNYDPHEHDEEEEDDK